MAKVKRVKNTTLEKRKKLKAPRHHGRNIRAPRLLEDGEEVVFIQYIYGTSVCFGTGVIVETKDLPSGYGVAMKDAVQYTIKGRRVFFHEGERHEDKGRYHTWLGASKIVVVPRSTKSVAWLKQSMRDWKAHLENHNRLMTSMKINHT